MLLWGGGLKNEEVISDCEGQIICECLKSTHKFGASLIFSLLLLCKALLVACF